MVVALALSTMAGAFAAPGGIPGPPDHAQGSDDKATGTAWYQTQAPQDVLVEFDAHDSEPAKGSVAVYVGSLMAGYGYDDVYYDATTEAWVGFDVDWWYTGDVTCYWDTSGDTEFNDVLFAGTITDSNLTDGRDDYFQVGVADGGEPSVDDKINTNRLEGVELGCDDLAAYPTWWNARDVLAGNVQVH